LQNKNSAVSSRHEPRKYNQQAAFDSLREPKADELAEQRLCACDGETLHGLVGPQKVNCIPRFSYLQQSQM
jgi:hypothetical protein